MEHDSHPDRRGQAKRSSKTEGMKERQNSENLVVPPKHEDLIQLLDIAGNVVVREYDALRVARASAGEDDRRDVIEARLVDCSDSFLDESHGQQPGDQRSTQSLERTWLVSQILQHDRLRRYLKMYTLQKCLRRNHRLQFALLGARRQNFVGRG